MVSFSSGARLAAVCLGEVQNKVTAFLREVRMFRFQNKCTTPGTNLHALAIQLIGDMACLRSKFRQSL